LLRGVVVVRCVISGVLWAVLGSQAFLVLHVLSLTHYVTARLPQFPYQEHYDLVQEHLRLIAVASGADPNSTSALAGSKAGSAMPVDEEWSEGEEDDGMAVDK
jgi:hypothetical protein